jgi:hypothetical protein
VDPEAVGTLEVGWRIRPSGQAPETIVGCAQSGDQ